MMHESDTTTRDYPVLYDYYPELQEHLSWMQLGTLPTPVHRLTRFSHENLWIKRDDQTSTIYGGNKVRKLEFLLADAVRRKKSEVFTLGGIGTNHGLATAIFSQRLGLPCTLYLFSQPVTRYVLQNLRLFHRYGARMIYRGGMLRTGLSFYLSQLLRRSAYAIYAGGSNPVGTLGFVNAVFELRNQIEANMLPEPEYIICPFGSGGTLAGMCLGIKLAGLRSQVIGVRVAYSHLGPLQLSTPQTVRTLMEKTYAFLKDNAESVPAVEIVPPKIIHDYFGEGYGHPTPEGIEALQLFKERENIKLEPTYTAKTGAALLDFVQKVPQGACILYWHTYNSVDLSKEAAGVDYHDLPRSFHRFFESGDHSLE